MKSVYLRAGLSLLCAATLAACGGSNGNLQLTGTISGLSKPGLVLRNGNATLAVEANTTRFVFPDLIAEDADFDIVVDPGHQPTAANCVVNNGKNRANYYTIGQIAVVCTTETRNLGGTVTGLDGAGLVLANGASTVSIEQPAVAGAPVDFTFAAKVADGSPYGVTVLAQPQGTSKVCTVSNGVGTMGASAVTTIAVSCQKP
ncbi:hypothetical protein HSX11_12780 [Oxalobacteraceae bacterium]|nr:hypothetical protein [Oxalobacteraceae bacterium]